MGLLARRNRPMHLGPYKLEKIRRVEETTTLILENEIKRVPRRLPSRLSCNDDPTGLEDMRLCIHG